MILTALNDYYYRMVENSQSNMPNLGYMRQKITHMVLLSEEGQLKKIIPLGEAGKTGPQGVLMDVPWTLAGACRTSGKVAFPLWDKPKYSLGADGKKVYPNHFKEFQTHVKKLNTQIKDKGIQALTRFVEIWAPSDSLTLDNWEEITQGNICFSLFTENKPIHERVNFQSYWKSNWKEWCRLNESLKAQCLVSGDTTYLANLHQPVKGVNGAQSSGASIVSFNKNSFKSYGKDQSYNAPVSEQAAFAYTTALNYLLRRENGRCLQIGDSSTVFWAEKQTPAEDLLAEMFDVSAAPEENPGEGEAVQVTNKVRSYLAALRDGTPIDGLLDEIDPDTRFYILGLAPNQSRIAVRFWLPSTFGTIAQRVSKHYKHLSIERQYSNQPEFPALWQLLLETAVQQKKENIPPLLSGALTRCVLTGNRYPESLYTAVLGRIRADKQITYLRAAILKACLLRNHPDKAGEITMSLNQHRTDTPYLLGRLFSLLEKAQKDALGKNLNATIRNRFFGAASATPSVVFPQLLRLAQHHISKSEYGHLIDRQVQEVMQGINDFPPRLSLQEQGIFTIGYYHQNNANYQKNEKE